MPDLQLRTCLILMRSQHLQHLTRRDSLLPLPQRDNHKQRGSLAAAAAAMSHHRSATQQPSRQGVQWTRLLYHTHSHSITTHSRGSRQRLSVRELLRCSIRTRRRQRGVVLEEQQEVCISHCRHIRACISIRLQVRHSRLHTAHRTVWLRLVSPASYIV